MNRLFLKVVGLVVFIFSFSSMGKPLESESLSSVDIKRLASELKKELKAHYAKVHCERLTKTSLVGSRSEGFKLWQRLGLASGPVDALDVGETANILEKDKHHLNWSINDLADEVGLKNSYARFIGAGAAYEGELGFNAELIIDGQINGVWNNRIGFLTGGKNRGKPGVAMANTDKVGPLANIAFFGNENAEALWVSVESRIGSKVLDSFTETLKNILASTYPDQVMGLAGYVRVSETSGVSKDHPKIRMHVMPGFANYNLKPADVDQWLDLFNIEITNSNPFHMMSLIYSQSKNLPFSIRSEHSHGYLENQRIAGHYYGDISNSQNIRYDGIFVPIDYLHSVK